MRTATHQPAWTPDALTPADCAALCAHLGLVLPTPTTSFATIAIDANLSPDEIWSRTRTTTDLRVMIACAALRGTVTRLPDDPRLNPAPYPKSLGTTLPGDSLGPPAQSYPTGTPSKAAPTGSRRILAASSPRTPAPWHAPDAKILTVIPNPRRPGTKAYDLFRLYKVGMSYADCLAAGLTVVDLRWDTQRNHLTWGSDQKDT